MQTRFVAIYDKTSGYAPKKPLGALKVGEGKDDLIPF